MKQQVDLTAPSHEETGITVQKPLGAIAVFIAAATFFMLATSNAGLAIATAIVGSMSMTIAGQLKGQDQVADTRMADCAYAFIAAMLFGAAKTITGDVFQLSGSAWVTATALLFGGFVLLELVISTAFAVALTRITGRYASQVAVAINIHERGFGAFGRGR